MNTQIYVRIRIINAGDKSRPLVRAKLKSALYAPFTNGPTKLLLRTSLIGFKMASGSESSTSLVTVEESGDENDDISFPSLPEVLFELICTVSSRVYGQRCHLHGSLLGLTAGKKQVP